MKIADRVFLKKLDQGLQSIAPEGLSASTCEIPEKADFAYEEEERLVRKAGEYRKREFAAGRLCARLALGQCGIITGPIPFDDCGIPVWPEGAIAVISHSRGYCASVAGFRTRFSALGLDLEMTTRLTPAAIDRVVHRSEQEFVQSDQNLASLIFCAKEAFYKAQFPIWAVHANFKDVALSVDFDLGSAQITYISEEFPDELRRIAPLMQFRFEYVDDYVVALCWYGETPE